MEKNFKNKNYVIKSILIFTTVFIASFFACIPAFAKNNVSNISMDVIIHNNGSATITQQWQGTFDTGTEVYLPIEDRSLVVRNFKVSMNGRDFLRVEKWDVNQSFNNKSFRCGINETSKGIELCFGISNYGSNIYTFSYDIDPLVKAYDDGDGFNFQFINPGMDIFPTNVAIRMGLDNGMPLSTDNARIWGFGFNGQTGFTEGYAVAYTTSALTSYNYMNIMLGLYKGAVAPNIKGSGTFQDLHDKALEGSTYKETLDYIESKNREDAIFRIIFAAIFTLGVAGTLASIIVKIHRRNILKKFYKDGNYFRDTPNDGDIAMSHTLFHDFNIWNSKQSNVIGAIIMKMINDRNLEPIQEKSYGLFGKERISTNLKVGLAPKDPLSKELFDMIIIAAGDDGVLQENELKNYAEKNYTIFNDYLDSIIVRGRNSLNAKNCYAKVNGKHLKDLTPEGQKELGEVYGLIKFLDEFTLINERGVTEGVIWENLMVYATLFGVAKKVIEELKKVYPDRIAEIQNYEQTYYISDIYYRSLYFNAMNASRAAQALEIAKMAAEGLGGASSIGGGGGFSGGGGGGGTR